MWNITTNDSRIHILMSSLIFYHFTASHVNQNPKRNNFKDFKGQYYLTSALFVSMQVT